MLTGCMKILRQRMLRGLGLEDIIRRPMLCMWASRGNWHVQIARRHLQSAGKPRQPLISHKLQLRQPSQACRHITELSALFLSVLRTGLHHQWPARCPASEMMRLSQAAQTPQDDATALRKPALRKPPMTLATLTASVEVPSPNSAQIALCLAACTELRHLRSLAHLSSAGSAPERCPGRSQWRRQSCSGWRRRPQDPPRSPGASLPPETPQRPPPPAHHTCIMLGEMQKC